MKPEILAEWFTRQDYQVTRTASSYWIEMSSHIFQAFPFHWIINPEEEELTDLIKANKALGLRYSTSITSGHGKLSYHVVFPLDSEQFSLTGIPKKARHDIRKGLNHFRIEPIALNVLLNEGWDVRLETLTRQNRLDAETEHWWKRMCHSAEGLPGIEAWAAYSSDGMAASALVVQCDETCTIYYQQSRTSSLKYGVNNALAYVITSEMLKRPGIKQVFYGLQSLDARPAVDQFKFRMGFLAKPVRQTVRFHPYFTGFVNPFSLQALKQVRKIWPLALFSKAEGMMQFYLDGKKPIEQQHWPEILKREKTREVLLKESGEESFVGD